MGDTKLKNKVVTGLFWKLSERLGVQGVQFIIQVILARLLLPKDFGNIAIINVFILVATVLIQYGFSTALIQKINADNLDYSTAFYINLGISSIMYLSLFILAPMLGEFYKDVLLVSLLRVQALILFLGAFSSVQNAVLARLMDFRKSFYINLGGVISQGIVGIFMAISGWGIWSLVFGQLASSITMVILGFVFVKWKPSLKFSIQRARGLFVFGKNILLASVLETICNNIYSLAIGRVYTKEALGYYNRGQSIPSMLTNTIDGSIQGVLFPALSTCQSDLKQMKRLMRRAIRISCYLVFPVMAGIMALATPVISLLFTDKWLSSVPFVQMSCLTMAFYPIHTANLQAISASGRSDIYLKLEVVKKILLIVVLLITLQYSIYAVMLGSVFCSGFSTVINSWPNKKLFHYSILEQLNDILPSMILSIVMGSLVYIVESNMIFGNVGNMLVSITIGIIVYYVGSRILKIEELSYIKSSIIEFKRKYKNGLESKS